MRDRPVQHIHFPQQPGFKLRRHAFMPAEMKELFQPRLRNAYNHLWLLYRLTLLGAKKFIRFRAQGRTQISNWCPKGQGRFLKTQGYLQEGLHWFKKTSRMVLLSVQALEEWIKEG
jgi:hypothetical protein